ncbi:hypothetical protein LXL04_011448 [Taraxacum kok-saghyz]
MQVLGLPKHPKWSLNLYYVTFASNDFIMVWIGSDYKSTRLVIFSKLPTFSDLYTLTIASTNPKSISTNPTVGFTKSVTKWFTTDRVLVEDMIYLWNPIHHFHQIYENKPRSMSWYALNELQIHGINMYFPFFFFVNNELGLTLWSMDLVIFGMENFCKYGVHTGRQHRNYASIEMKRRKLSMG